jgi:DNA repair exonuclease SbcCD ATPase subunit
MTRPQNNIEESLFNSQKELIDLKHKVNSFSGTIEPLVHTLEKIDQARKQIEEIKEKRDDIRLQYRTIRQFNNKYYSVDIALALFDEVEVKISAINNMVQRYYTLIGSAKHLKRRE